METLIEDRPPPEEKIVLHDGKKRIEKITVLGLFRDNETYLFFLFKALEKFEQTYDCDFDYYFFENNSKDNTREFLTNFLDKRDGQLLLYNAKTDYKRTQHGMDYNRTSYIANLRNKLVKNVTPLDSDWCLFVDSNIYFDAMVLQQFFEYKPCKENIGMMGGFSQQIYPSHVLKDDVREKLGITDNRMITVNHYYDTFPFIDTAGKSHYPNCAFEKCKLCWHFTPGVDRDLISEDEDLVDVNSCFGGFVLIDTDIVNNEKIRWSTIGYESSMDLSLCEHVLYCDRLRTVTGKRVVVCQNIDKIFRTH